MSKMKPKLFYLINVAPFVILKADISHIKIPAPLNTDDSHS